MRKILLLFACAAISMGATASEFYLGGSLGLWRNETSKSTSLEIAPDFGVNLTPKWSIGTSIGYSHNNSDGYSLNLINLSPYARYNYFTSGIFTAFVDGGVSAGFGKSRYEGLDSDTAVEWSIGLMPGFSLSLAEHLSMEAHVGFLGYQGANSVAEYSGSEKGYGFSLSSGNLSFGFYYTF